MPSIRRIILIATVVGAALSSGYAAAASGAVRAVDKPMGTAALQPDCNHPVRNYLLRDSTRTATLRPRLLDGGGPACLKKGSSSCSRSRQDL